MKIIVYRSSNCEKYCGSGISIARYIIHSRPLCITVHTIGFSFSELKGKMKIWIGHMLIWALDTLCGRLGQ